MPGAFVRTEIDEERAVSSAVISDLGESTKIHVSAEPRLKALSLSIEYPNPYHQNLGLFVRSRLQYIAALADLKVVSPVALLDYSSPNRKWLLGGIPKRRTDVAIEVLHPRWFYPPFGTPANVVCLCLAVLPRILRLRGRFRFQILDAHFGYPDGVVAALLAAVLRIPFIVTLRGNEPFFAETPSRGWCIRWALRRAACVVTVSERLRQFAIGQGVDPARTKVIGNGVDANVFHPRNRHDCRIRHNLPLDAKLVLTAGSLLEAKGHHRVIRAIAELVKHGENACLVIAGDETRGGPGFRRKLVDIVTGLGLESRVHFPGWVSPQSLAELMCAADVFCLASDSEGWPNVIHEAASCGTPVVVTDVGSVPEMIPSERLGLVVPVGDQRRLEQALSTALSRAWDRDSIASWAQSRSWSHVAGEVVAVMREALKCVE
jgi:teichuronic acid biosynthesis glycosyltransferase TuaC